MDAKPYSDEYIKSCRRGLATLYMSESRVAEVQARWLATVDAIRAEVRFSDKQYRKAAEDRDEWKLRYEQAVRVLEARAEKAETIARDLKQQSLDRGSLLVDAVERAEKAEAERDEALALLGEARRYVETNGLFDMDVVLAPLLDRIDALLKGGATVSDARPVGTFEDQERAIKALRDFYGDLVDRCTADTQVMIEYGKLVALISDEIAAARRAAVEACLGSVVQIGLEGASFRVVYAETIEALAGTDTQPGTDAGEEKREL